MPKTLHKICTGLILTLGVLHCSFTLHDYREFSLGALWFLGTGVAIVLAGFLNVTLSRDAGRDRVVRWLCHFTNITFAILFAVASSLLPQPQVYFGAALFAVTTVLGFMQKGTAR